MMDRSLVFAAILFGLLLLMPFLLPLFGSEYLIGLIIKAMLLAIAAISLDLLIGHGGMVSLGHAAFVGVGAYATAIGLENGIENILLLLVITLAVTGFVALVTGSLALRTSGVYFLMITLAFGQMTYFTLTSLAAYGGDDGLTLWSLATLFGSDIVQSGSGLYFLVLGTLFATWWGVFQISRSRFGRVLRAARDKGLVMLDLPLAEFVSPALATWQRSGDLIVVVVLGGLGSRNGAILGAFFIVIIEEVLGSFVHEWRLIYGPVLVLMVLFAKGGIADLFVSKDAKGRVA